MFLLVPVHRDPEGRIAGGTVSPFFPRAILLRVKRGAPEHRDSGALTGSPALTPGLDHGIAAWHTSGG